jgi:hypothetical protein
VEGRADVAAFADPRERLGQERLTLRLRHPMQTQKQKMLAGELYVADDPELAEDNRRISAWPARGPAPPRPRPW